MPKIRIRAATIGLLLLSAVLVVVGVIYLANTAAHLPSFFPGHTADGTQHHVKHGLAALTLALLVLGAAWFTTSPEHPPN